MTYKDIIKDNCKSHSDVKWWPKFAFHYTDVTNAVSILSSGRLYSRTQAKAMGVMRNDNASIQVINMTETEAKAKVRFYFRPLTPTQYHNEGFKHPSLRYDGDPNANVPVPVFLLFDLEKLLSTPGVRFSEFPQSGYGSISCNNVEEFAKFNFDKIYSKGYTEDYSEIKKYRHAEIIYPNFFEIDNYISNILCRNSIEQTTLLNLLKEENAKVFYKYKSMIKVCREDVFENNALFVKSCQYHNGTVSISFSDFYLKKKYTNSAMQRNSISTLDPIAGRLELVWANAQTTCYQTTIEMEVDYQNTVSITCRNLPSIPRATFVEIRFFLKDKIMCFVKQTLEKGVLIK